MVECYGVFCGHHNEAMSFYKEQMQNNKKMQLLMRVSRPHALALPAAVLPVFFAGKRNRKSFPFHSERRRREWRGVAWSEARLLKTKAFFHGRKSDSWLWCGGWEYPSASCW